LSPFRRLAAPRFAADTRYGAPALLLTLRCRVAERSADFAAGERLDAARSQPVSPPRRAAAMLFTLRGAR